MKKTATHLIVIFILIANLANAQDPQFTQFYANPLYLNPAFAGSNICPRFCLNYRNEWPAITGTFVTYSASYDQYVHGVSGGLGLLVTHDEAGQATLNTTRVSGIYAYKKELTRDVSLSVGFEATYHQKSVDWDKVNYGDEIDPKHGYKWNPTMEVRGESVSRLDLSAGILVYGDRFYAGFSAHHLNTPNESVKKGDSKLPMKYTAHAGFTRPLGGNSIDEASISPNIIYQQQQDFHELNLGLYVSKGPLVGGMWYRGRDAFILLVGFQMKTWKCGYTYDMTISKLANATAGSHELSFSKRFACKPHKIRYRPTLCPSF